jgi:hypothetical protein
MHRDPGGKWRRACAREGYGVLASNGRVRNTGRVHVRFAEPIESFTWVTSNAYGEAVPSDRFAVCHEIGETEHVWDWDIKKSRMGIRIDPGYRVDLPEHITSLLLDKTANSLYVAGDWFKGKGMSRELFDVATMVTWDMTDIDNADTRAAYHLRLLDILHFMR